MNVLLLEQQLSADKPYLVEVLLALEAATPVHPAGLLSVGVHRQQRHEGGHLVFDLETRGGGTNVVVVVVVVHELLSQCRIRMNKWGGGRKGSSNPGVEGHPTKL